MPTILIVDDSASNRAIYARLAATLGEGDTKAVEMATPSQALEWLKTNTADLIITDFRMPEMDGAEFTRFVRASATGSDIPVIVITAYNERDYSTQAFDAGATEFLRTPIDHTEFRVRGENVLRMHRQHKELQSHARRLEQELRASEQELRASEQDRQAIVRNSHEALAQVIDTIPALISAKDREGRFTFANAMHARIRGAGGEGRPDVPAIDPFGFERAQKDASLDQLVFTTGGALPAFEEELLEPGGGKLVLLTTKTPLRNTEDEVVAVVTTAVDITARKAADEELFFLAHHDPLTGLPNRLLLTRRLDQAVARGGRGDHVFAVHFIDLDKFKSVNDDLGHLLGDELLRRVSARLTASVRSTDVVARLGGDEFAILQSPVASEAEAVAFATRIMDSLRSPYLVDDKEVGISGSVGTALFPRDGKTYSELINNSDLAMYSGKLANRDQHRMFSPAMEHRVGWRLRMREDLRRAVVAGELHLVYQPQIDWRSGNVVAVEALLRWRTPEGIEIPPSEFLAVAEESNLIATIDALVMMRACAQAAAWLREGGPPIRMCVNVSPAGFDVMDIHGLVERAIETSGLAPHLLELELTEQTLAKNVEGAVSALQQVKRLGVQIAIDDFGIGYSSMDALRKFPVDRLKIDRSFVMNVATNRADRIIVRAIIDLGRSLELGVIAEGVETIEQVTFLVGEGCNDIQGHFFSKPVLPEEIPAMVRRSFLPLAQR